MHRTSGILLHPTSLPSPFGIGDLGPCARHFVDFLAEAGQGLWQMLPLGPTGYQDSPYQCTSAFAGNPLLISPQDLVQAGWLTAAAVEARPEFPDAQVDFGAVSAWKHALLQTAWDGFNAGASAADRLAFTSFCAAEAGWLEDFVRYCALKLHHKQLPWTDWEPALAQREPEALAHWSAAHSEALELHRFAQFVFFQQWQALRTYAHQRGVHLIGDIPIFVAHDSSEVWTHPDWFALDASGHPAVIAGVPPDYFSTTGQRWGNPLYRWDVLAADGYQFWINRLQRMLQLVDLVRIDHFRGFAAYWEIPAAEETAINGRWVEGPGLALFQALQAALGTDLPLIAEDLGVITPDVEMLRDTLQLPGMAVLQFGFEGIEGDFGRSAFLPHHHRPRQAVYTGTHDNNSLQGWWAERDPATQHQICRYLNSSGEDIHWDGIRAALSSVAAFALFPLQDVLGLGAESCMNRPGIASGNWQWRYCDQQLNTTVTAAHLRELTRLYGRLPFAAH